MGTKEKGERINFRDRCRRSSVPDADSGTGTVAMIEQTIRPCGVCFGTRWQHLMLCVCLYLLIDFDVPLRSLSRRSCPVHHAHLPTVILHDRSGPACLRAGKSDSFRLPGLFLARLLSTLSSFRISAILSPNTSRHILTYCCEASTFTAQQMLQRSLPRVEIGHRRYAQNTMQSVADFI